MAKRKEVCCRCGFNPQELHSMCFTCHEFDHGPTENCVAKVGNDYFARCDEKDCFICDEWKWQNKRTRPPKYSKKELLNRARGRYGRTNKQSAIKELNRRGIDFHQGKSSKTE